METTHNRGNLKAVVQQTTNNTTSWIGNIRGESKSRVSGQTFTCPETGELESIEVYSSHVINNGTVDLALHAFDAETKSWGAELGTSKVEFNSNNSNRWISFNFHGIRLQKGLTYGFRLKSDTGLVGVGEAASSASQGPNTSGQEWIENAENHRGKFYSYLSLAFKVEMRA
ncbi:MAG TPA: hypothetical protein VHL77_08175 [Ferruginibacter sp.]|jgi:hypothetical protein|nr:hypothetical protein [Ferruginibacter sp.]